MIATLELLSNWAIPLVLIIVPLIALTKKVPVYESFVSGAKEGFTTAIRIIPFLVAMLIAIKVFQQSGVMNLLINLIAPITSYFNIPKEVIPLALIRPLSGSGALGMLTSILETYGPDSFVGFLASTMQGSTETTFYVLTVYFGAINIRKLRHSLAACLLTDIAGFLASAYIVHRIFNG